MGQYYKPINLMTKQWLSPWAYDNGAKLMEHSYVGNNFVGAVMKLLSNGGSWYKAPMVWAGDYYGEKEEEDYYHNVTEENKITPKSIMTYEEQKNAVLVNHTKKQYVLYEDMQKDGHKNEVNPLPLLTALGNVRGGGDYRSNNSDFDKVGIWATDILSVETNIPDGYEKIIVKFGEK